LRPRTFGQALSQVVAGPLAPSGYNRQIGQERAAEMSGTTLPAPERAYRDALRQAQADAKRFEVPGGVPRAIVEDLLWRRDRDLAIATAEKKKGSELDPREKARRAAALLVRRYPQARK